MRLVKALNKYLTEKLLPEMTLKEAYEQHKIIYEFVTWLEGKITGGN